MKLAKRASAEEAIAALDQWKGEVHALGLPSAPARPVVVTRDDARPQHKHDVNAGNGMTVTVGRVRHDPILDLRLVAIGHNIHARRGGRLGAERRARRGARDRARVIVLKFGGTSVQDASAIDRAAAITRSRASRAPVVVVSALGGTTNALLAIAEQAARGQLIVALSGVEELRDAPSARVRGAPRQGVGRARPARS